MQVYVYIKHTKIYILLGMYSAQYPTGQMINMGPAKFRVISLMRETKLWHKARIINW